MGSRFQQWTAGFVLLAMFGAWMGGAVASLLPHDDLEQAGRHASTAVYRANHGEGPVGPRGCDPYHAFDQAELEDPDDDPTQRTQGLALLTLVSSTTHRLHGRDVRQRPAHEPPTRPPRA